jgi:hypothetical protein
MALIGKKVVRVRSMTKKELEAEGWADYSHRDALVMVFDDGTKVFASRDEEGNGPGALFGNGPDDGSFYVEEERG